MEEILQGLKHVVNEIAYGAGELVANVVRFVIYWALVGVVSWLLFRIFLRILIGLGFKQRWIDGWYYDLSKPWTILAMPFMVFIVCIPIVGVALLVGFIYLCFN